MALANSRARTPVNQEVVGPRSCHSDQVDPATRRSAAWKQIGPASGSVTLRPTGPLARVAVRHVADNNTRSAVFPRGSTSRISVRSGWDRSQTSGITTRATLKLRDIMVLTQTAICRPDNGQCATLAGRLLSGVEKWQIRIVFVRPLSRLRPRMCPRQRLQSIKWSWLRRRRRIRELVSGADLLSPVSQSASSSRSAVDYCLLAVQPPVESPGRSGNQSCLIKPIKKTLPPSGGDKFSRSSYCGRNQG